MRRGIVTALVLIGGLAVVPVAAGSDDLHIVTQQAVPIGGSTGSFALSGDLSDAGTFRFTSFLFTSGFGSAVTTEHVSEIWSGAAGTISVEKECRSVFVGAGATDDCRALVTGGTGAYEGMHGVGTCSGFINFITGIASQSCDLRLKS